jgi:hypothetical protein
MGTNLNRRAFIAAASTSTIAVAMPAAAISASTILPDRSAWAAAIAAFERVQEEERAFNPGYLRLRNQCDKECEGVPHVTFDPDPGLSYLGHASTENPHFVRRARREVEDLDAGRMRFDPLPDLQAREKKFRDVVRAADERDTKVDAIRSRYGMDVWDDRSEALTDRFIATRDALMEMPAPDLAALRWKLDQLPDCDGSLAAWSADFVRQTFADIDRLLPAGA